LDHGVTTGGHGVIEHRAGTRIIDAFYRRGIGRFDTADRRGGGVDAGLALIQGREHGAFVANIADRE
jgi:hypothetical protein